MTLPAPVTTGESIRSREATGRPVASVLLVAAVAGAAGTGFLGVAPNRILSAVPIHLWQIEPRWIAAAVGLGAAIMGLAILFAAPRRYLAGLTGSMIMLIAAVAGAGAAASAKVAALGGGTARVSLGPGFWLVGIAAALAISDGLRRLGASTAVRAALAVVVIGGFALLAVNGWFDDLSLVREWANQRDIYALAFDQHMTLVVSALVLSLLAGAPLGVVAARQPRLSTGIFATLNIFQTIPSIALFGLLIGPLTGLSTSFPALRAIGINGIGFTPGIIALVLYSLLPVARNVEAALRSVPDSLLETARAMGMTSFQSLVHVALPLALPVLLAGLRIVVVQLIGLAVVAALIGAGGFGSFVFLGLGQSATDLVLLGALSAIAIAVVADALLRLLSAAALARVRS